MNLKCNMVAGLEPGAGGGCVGKMSINVFFGVANGMASMRTSFLLVKNVPYNATKT